MNMKKTFKKNITNLLWIKNQLFLLSNYLSNYVNLLLKKYIFLMQKKNERPIEEIVCMSFNQDRSCLALGTTRGFKIYTTDPFELKQNRDFAISIGLIQMINRSNLIAIVVSADKLKNKLRIWDDKSQQYISESTFKSEIIKINIRQKKIIVATINKIFVLNFSTLQVQNVFQTSQNQNGLFAASNNPNNFLITIPRKGVPGGALICFLEKNTQLAIKAHQSTLSLLQISSNGHKLATASQKGIQIRIYNTKNGQMLQQLRRGNQFATIYSVTFNENGLWLSVSSDSCNVHIFALKLTEEEKQEKYELKQDNIEKTNPKSLFYFMRNVIPFFDSQYSFAHFKIPEFQTDLVTQVAFNRDDCLLIASNFGKLYTIVFDPNKSGECKNSKEYNIL